MCSAMTWSRWLSIGRGSCISLRRYSRLGVWHRSTARPLVSSRGLEATTNRHAHMHIFGCDIPDGCTYVWTWHKPPRSMTSFCTAVRPAFIFKQTQNPDSRQIRSLHRSTIALIHPVGRRSTCTAVQQSARSSSRDTSASKDNNNLTTFLSLEASGFRWECRAGLFFVLYFMRNSVRNKHCVVLRSTAPQQPPEGNDRTLQYCGALHSCGIISLRSPGFGLQVPERTNFNFYRYLLIHMHARTCEVCFHLEARPVMCRRSVIG